MYKILQINCSTISCRTFPDATCTIKHRDKDGIIRTAYTTVLYHIPKTMPLKRNDMAALVKYIQAQMEDVDEVIYTEYGVFANHLGITWKKMVLYLEKERVWKKKYDGSKY